MSEGSDKMREGYGRLSYFIRDNITQIYLFVLLAVFVELYFVHKAGYVGLAFFGTFIAIMFFFLSFGGTIFEFIKSKFQKDLN